MLHLTVLMHWSRELDFKVCWFLENCAAADYTAQIEDNKDNASAQCQMCLYLGKFA